jgi:hypothetical protein
VTEHLDPRASWIRQRIYELQQAGLRYAAAREQAEAEAEGEFGSEENGLNGDCNGNGNGGAA